MADGAGEDVSEERVLLGAAEADVRYDLVEGAEEGQLQPFPEELTSVVLSKNFGSGGGDNKSA